MRHSRQHHSDDRSRNTRSTFFALAGPPGLLAEIVTLVHKEVAAALAKPEVGEQTSKQGVIVRSITPAAFAVYPKDQNAIWKAALTDAGLQLQ